MGAIGDARRRSINRNGRTLILRRETGGAPMVLNVKGVPSQYTPGEIEGAIQQGDERVELLHDEFAADAAKAAGWDGPRVGDWICIDGRWPSVIGASEVREASALIGHRLWVRGG